MDGEERVYDIPESHQWEAGKAYTYTLTLKGDIIAPLTWRSFRLMSAIGALLAKLMILSLAILKVTGLILSLEKYHMVPTSIGMRIYVRILRILDRLGSGNREYAGYMGRDFRMVLMDNTGNIVDKFQPCSIVAENGAMMKGTARRSYVTAQQDL